jgi:hypothetical protein
MSFDDDGPSVLLELGEINAFGNRDHQLVEQAHDLRAALLKLLDNLHAREEIRLDLLEIFELFDLTVQLRDLALQKLISGLLIADPLLDLQVDQHRQKQREDQRETSSGGKLLVSPLPRLFSPRQEVDARHLVEAS